MHTVFGAKISVKKQLSWTQQLCTRPTKLYECEKSWTAAMHDLKQDARES